MELIERELDIIKNEIQKDFTEPFESEPVFDYVFSKSKTIRGCFVVLYLKTVGIELTDDMYKVLAAGEIIHNASLLHDDVVDESEKRRNNISVWKRYDSRIAVLLGDYLLSFAVGKILNTNSQIISNFKNCINCMCMAEFKQYSLRNKSLSIEEYIEICKNKTGILFGTILESCVFLAGKDSFRAKEFAEKFGIYFQLNNDYEDYSSNQDKKNKIHTASDILGIEKANALIDNYRKELISELKKFPDNEYKSGLERLITELCLIKKN